MDTRKILKIINNYYKLIFVYSEDTADLKSYHQTIVDHKEVIRTLMSLQGVIVMMKDDIAHLGNVSFFLMTRKPCCVAGC